MSDDDAIETYAYGKRKELACKNEEIKCSKIKELYIKWLNLMKEHNC